MPQATENADMALLLSFFISCVRKQGPSAPPFLKVQLETMTSPLQRLTGRTIDRQSLHLRYGREMKGVW